MVKKFSLFILLALVLCGQSFAQDKKNVILLIGDGAGPAVMAFLMQYAKLAPSSPYQDRLSNLEKLMQQGSLAFVFNTPVDTVVIDSAAAGTQIATGVKTYPTAIGVDAQGGPVTSILAEAKEAGYGTGLVTTVYLQDATPAVFAAHQKSRKMYTEISRDLLRTSPDVMLGGGMDYFISKADLNDPKYTNILQKIHYLPSVQGKASENGLFEDLLKSGYQLVFDKKTLAKAKGPKLLGLFAPQGLPFVLERKAAYPTLMDMTQKALEILSKKDKGFFLMVEAGLIDWAAHANDQGAMLKELLEFDETLAVLADFAAKNTDTLLIVTADHDTAGFAFTYRKLEGEELARKKEAGYPLYEDTDYAAFSNFDLLTKQNKSFYNIIKDYEALPAKNKTPKTIQKIIKDNTGFDLTEEMLAGETDINKALAKITEMTGIAWASGNHTAEPVLAVFNAPSGAAVKYPAVLHSTELKKIMQEHLF